MNDNKQDLEFEHDEDNDKQSTESLTNKSDKQTTGAVIKEPYVNNEAKVNENSIKISMPSLPMDKFNKVMQYFSNLDIDESALEDWKEVTEEAVELYTTNGLYQDRLREKDALFKQGIERESGELKSITNLKFKKSDGELKGEVAVLKVAKMLGLGDVLSIPLPHSGIWVTIKPPTEKDLIDFYNNIFKDKILLGRATSGLTLGNFSVYINNRLFDFILNHIHSINYKDINKSELKKYILISDLPILAWGFAATIYPNGFDFQRACTEDIEKCTYIAKEVINMTKLLWIDNSSLTQAQKTILFENRPSQLTIESYKKYIVEHNKVTSREFTISNGIKIKLKTPTIEEYVSDGLNWINKINTTVETTIIETEDTEEAKTQLLDQYVKASILRQFSHFIDYLEIEDNVIVDRDTINEVLEALSSDDNSRNEIFNEIIKYKNDSIIALIGIPEYECPKCKTQQNSNPINERFIDVIPLDVMNIFFILITIRITKILERNV